MGRVLRGRFPRRHLVAVVARNAGRYLVNGAARNWVRNLGATAPALGSMTLLLLLAGVVGLSGFALRSAAMKEAQNAAVLHVYLKDDAKSADVDALRAKLESSSRVKSVAYTSKAQALARAQHRPGLSDLAGASDSNPFPASLDVSLQAVQDVGPVAASVKGDPAVDPILSTSYDPGAYQRLQTAMTWVAAIGVAFLALLGAVAVMVTANGVRAAVHARGEEVAIMQLVGAPRWMVRGPFVLEGALTGAAAGVVAAVVTAGLGLAAVTAASGRFAQLAPGLTGLTGLAFGAAVLVAGVVLGSGSTLVGVHRHLEF